MNALINIGKTFNVISYYIVLQMKEFFAKYPDAGAGARAREQSIETVQNNIQWLKINKPDLENWLKENGFM